MHGTRVVKLSKRGSVLRNGVSITARLKGFSPRAAKSQFCQVVLFVYQDGLTLAKDFTWGVLAKQLNQDTITRSTLFQAPPRPAGFRVQWGHFDLYQCSPFITLFTSCWKSQSSGGLICASLSRMGRLVIVIDVSTIVSNPKKGKRSQGEIFLLKYSSPLV